MCAPNGELLFNWELRDTFLLSALRKEIHFSQKKYELIRTLWRRDDSMKNEIILKEVRLKMRSIALPVPKHPTLETRERRHDMREKRRGENTTMH